MQFLENFRYFLGEFYATRECFIIFKRILLNIQENFTQFLTTLHAIIEKSLRNSSPFFKKI